MTETNCRGCVHWRIVGRDSAYRVCHYLEDTGLPRCCPPDRCTHKLSHLPRSLPERGPWSLSQRDTLYCCACGEEIRGAALDVTDVAQLPWRYAFLHRDEECCRTFYREQPERCHAFFAGALERLMVEKLSALEAEG